MNLQKITSTSGGKCTEKQILNFANQLFWYCFLAYVCSYIGRKNFSACLPEMIKENFLTEEFGGYISAAYMIVYGVGQLVNGILGSRYQPKYMIGIGLFGATICNFFMGVLSSKELMVFVWAANGIFHSMLWAPIIRVFTDQIPDERRIRAGANIGAACSVGAILALVIPGQMIKYGCDWRTVFFVSAIILFVAFIVWVLGNRYLRNYLNLMDIVCKQERVRMFAQTSTVGGETSNNDEATQKYTIIGVVVASGIWLILFGLLFNGALRDGVESWVPTFLYKQFNTSPAFAATISVIVPIVSISGTYFSNWLNNKHIKNELHTAGWMFVIASLAVLGIYLTRNTNAIICVVFLSISVAAMWGSNHMFLTRLPYHFAKYGLSAAMTGAFNSIIYFASALAAGLYGILAARVGWDKLIIVWLIAGIGGTIFCFLSGRAWLKSRPSE